MLDSLNHSWSPAPPKIELTSKEIHLWLAPLESMAPYIGFLQSTLAPDEMERAEHFHYTKDRNCYIATHGLLRKILSRYINISPERIRFQYNIHGKPYLKPLHNKAELQFNMSHSFDFALYGIAYNDEIGIDIEQISPIPEIDKLMDDYFTVEEKSHFKMLSLNDRIEKFFRYWTLKEAYMKAKGRGLDLSVSQVEVQEESGKFIGLIDVKEKSKETSHWSIYSLSPAAGYAAAAVTKKSCWNLSCWQITHPDLLPEGKG